MKQIETGDESHTLEMIFKDKYNEFMVPTAVTYEIYNVTEEAEVVAETVLTPAKKISLDLTGDMVTLVDSTNKKEIFRVCVNVTDATNTYVRCYEYEVVPVGCSCG